MTELLRDKLARLKAEAAVVEREIAKATCATAGCDMQSVGGANAGCGDDCHCSVPVHECRLCHASDYGDNDEAREIRRLCADMNGWTQP